MQVELLLDLVGGSGEKPASAAPASGPSWDDLEYSAEELEALAVVPVKELADHYAWLLEVDPLARNRRAVQLRQVMRQRGLSHDALSEPQDQGHAKVRNDWRG